MKLLDCGSGRVRGERVLVKKKSNDFKWSEKKQIAVVKNHKLTEMGLPVRTKKQKTARGGK